MQQQLQASVVWNYQKFLTDNTIQAMAKVKITQVKSGIDRTEVQKRNLKALGLRMHKTVEKELTPQIKGMIAKVAHLVTVES